MRCGHGFVLWFNQVLFMNDVVAPQPNTITKPALPSPPRPRAMDTRVPAVETALTTKEDNFFLGKQHAVDTVINMLSTFGSFKVESYPNQGNPNDIQYVVFFNNTATQETFEVHGTIALFYINEVRNKSSIQDFPISDSLIWKANAKDGISYFSQYTLRWEQATNNVIKKFYKPYNPAQSTVESRLHDFDPLLKNTLVGYTEEYSIASAALNFANWKDEANLGKYNGSIGIRSVGMPFQILLHETAGFGNLSIPNVREVKTKDGKTFFPIPHFCVNNLDDKGKGNIIQFVDVATNVPHGEVTNQRAIGIEFVNPPIEAFLPNSKGQLEPVFNLETSQKGIYLKTKLAGLGKLFIPLEFSADAGTTYYELALKKDRLINFAALSAGLGPDKKKIVFEHDGNVLIKFAKSDRFEHLATLVSSLVANSLVKQIDNLTNENYWAPVVTLNNTRFYLFEHGNLKQQEGTHFFFDIRAASVLTHLLIGSDHVDGGVQGLYMYLKFVRRVPVEAILQLIISFLTSDKSVAETKKIKLKSQVLLQPGSGFVVPPKPIEKEFSDILELDEALINASIAP